MIESPVGFDVLIAEIPFSDDKPHLALYGQPPYASHS